MHFGYYGYYQEHNIARDLSAEFYDLG